MQHNPSFIFCFFWLSQFSCTSPSAHPFFLFSLLPLSEWQRRVCEKNFDIPWMISSLTSTGQFIHLIRQITGPHSKGGITLDVRYCPCPGSIVATQVVPGGDGDRLAGMKRGREKKLIMLSDFFFLLLQTLVNFCKFKS